MKLNNIINSVSTAINSNPIDTKKYIFEIMSHFYNEGFNPSYLLVNKNDIKMVKNIFKSYKRGDWGKYVYETDFGLLNIIQNKEMPPSEIMVTDKY